MEESLLPNGDRDERRLLGCPNTEEETLPLVAACGGEATTETVQAQQQLQQQHQLPATAAVVSSDTASFMPTDLRVMSSMHEASYAKMIDNRFINYVAIKLRCGVIAMCRTNVLTLCPSVLKNLNRDLTTCLEIMPPSVHAFIRRTRVWVNLNYSYGAHDDPRLLRHTTAHHDQGWLIWARDRPDKVNSIEIYDCRDYERQRWHWNGPGLILHELCHLIHQHCLEDGLHNLRVFQAYCKAKNNEEGLYDNTLRRDWAGLECETDLAYAMVDNKEFFAEMSVTYLCDSYHELDEEDKTSMERCCPPCLEPTVVQRLQQQQQQQQQQRTTPNMSHTTDAVVVGIPQRRLLRNKSSTTSSESQKTKDDEFCCFCCSPWRIFRFFVQRFWKQRKVDTVPRQTLPHCNKFYPFTRGQLRYHDIETYRVMSDLWHEIELWDDPLDDRFCGKGIAWRRILPPFVKHSKFQSDVS